MRHHQRTHQYRAAGGAALTTLEVAVRSRSAKLVADELVVVHGKAHRAARLTPLETRFRKDFVEPLFARDCVDNLRTGDCESLDARGNPFCL